MRKVLAVLVAVSLLCIAPAQAATKPGSKCTKAGATINSAGKKFTCIKSSGKLVWNKGVTIKKSSAIKAGVCPPKAAADLSSGITQVRANALISMTEAAAEECALNLEWTYRLGQRDDEIFAGTFDYRTDRVTVTVMKGLVTQVNVG
jgi:hypothetical protein